MARLTKVDVVALKYDGLVDKIDEVQRRTLHQRFACDPSDPKQLYNKLLQHQAEILELRSRGIIHRDKYKFLFPPSGETNSRNLDTTTMHALLRNFGGYTKPTTGWDKEPAKGDTSEIANLIRLNRGRHEGRGHIVKYLRTNTEFKKLHQKLEPAFLGLGCSANEIEDLLRFHVPIKHKFKPAVDEFIAREQELKIVHAKMQKLETNKMGLVVHALAGVGKSELARSYFQANAASYNNNVVWVNAASLENSFQELAVSLRLQVKDENGNYLPIQTIIDDVHTYLADDKVLFIFDNANNIQHEQIMPYLPQAKQNFSLITSQVSKWSSSYFYTFPLPLLNEEEAVGFVKQEFKETNYQFNEPTEALNGIVKFLDGHLFALKHFTTYIKETGTSFENYLRLIKAQPLKASLDPDQNPMSAISINITRLTQLEGKHSDLAKNILHCMRFLNGQEIHRGFFFYLNFGDASNNDLSCANVNTALYLLEKYSLINIEKSDKSNDQNVISIHSLVQKTLQIIQEKVGNELEMYQYLLKHFIQEGDKQFLHMRKINFRHFNFWYRQFIHIYKENVLRDEFLQFFTDHVYYFTDVLLNRCEFNTCEEILAGVSRHKDPRLLYRVLFCKGFCFATKCEFSKSMEIYKEVLDKQLSLFGPTDCDYLRTSLEYGEALCLKGDGQEGFHHLLQLQEVQRNVLGEFHSETLSGMRMIACSKLGQNLFVEVLEDFRLVLVKQTELYSSPHPAITKTIFHISLIVDNKTRQNLLLDMFKSCEEMYPTIHPASSMRQMFMAVFMFELGEIDSCLEMIQTALFSLQLIYGPKDIKVCCLKFSLSVILLDSSKHEDGLALLLDVIDTLETKNQPCVIYVKAFLVSKFMVLQDTERAYECLQDLLEACVVEDNEYVVVKDDKYTMETVAFADLLMQGKVHEAKTFVPKIICELDHIEMT